MEVCLCNRKKDQRRKQDIKDQLFRNDPKIFFGKRRAPSEQVAEQNQAELRKNDKDGKHDRFYEYQVLCTLTPQEKMSNLY